MGVSVLCLQFSIKNWIDVVMRLVVFRESENFDWMLFCKIIRNECNQATAQPKMKSVIDAYLPYSLPYLNQISAVNELERTDSSIMSCTVTSTCTGTGVSSGIADLRYPYWFIDKITVANVLVTIFFHIISWLSEVTLSHSNQTRNSQCQNYDSPFHSSYSLTESMRNKGTDSSS